MKNKLLALLATIGLVSSVSAVEINENLSIGGFIDGSYENVNAAADTETLEIDEIQIDITANVGGVTGQLSLEQEAVTGGADLGVESVTIGYTLENGLGISFGRFARINGFERDNPTNLYTYSRAHDGSLANYQLATQYVEGLALSYAVDALSLSASVTTDQGDLDDDSDFEVRASYAVSDDLNIGLGYLADGGTGGSERNEVIVDVSYQLDRLLLAAEFITASDDSTTAGEDAYLLLADYDFNDKLGLAVRFSEAESSSTDELTTVAIAPNYAITDSLSAIVEYSDSENNAGDSEVLAVELLFTF